MALLNKNNSNFSNAISSFDDSSDIYNNTTTMRLDDGDRKNYRSTKIMNWFLKLFYVMVLLLISFFLSEMTFRLILFINEIIFHRHHYIPFSFGFVFNFTFTFNWSTIILIFTSVILFLVLLHFKSFKIFWRNNSKLLTQICTGVLLVNLLTRAIETNYSTLNHVHWIRNTQVMDYGSGMASSYYYGYLNIIGPNHGDHRRGILERIEDYESTYGVEFPVKKLFIMIPESLYIPTDLSEHSATLIQTNISLTALTVDRGGIAKRIYRSSVYHLKNESWYVSAEGATPLQTYREALDASGDETMNLMKHEVVLKFYSTLKNLIYKHESTRHKFELVYYKPVEGKNSDIGEIILQRIKEILADI